MKIKNWNTLPRKWKKNFDRTKWLTFYCVGLIWKNVCYYCDYFGIYNRLRFDAPFIYLTISAHEWQLPLNILNKSWNYTITSCPCVQLSSKFLFIFSFVYVYMFQIHSLGNHFNERQTLDTNHFSRLFLFYKFPVA